ncbi:MAG TPA: hypothetical protein VGL84_07035 [Gaiellaceae bacterium]|jgi:RimJ/RimL family protein N-acetyltransferase
MLLRIEREVPARRRAALHEWLQRPHVARVFTAPGTTACVADVDVDNSASLRAFAKAGFRPVGEIVDPQSGRPHTLLRRDR